MFKYLGINIQSPLESFIDVNLWPIIRAFRERIQKWRDLELTLLGKVNLLKMFYLTKFLYVLSNTPVYIPQKICRHINYLSNSFLWGSKSTRVSLVILQLPVDQGGLALHDLRLYYFASQLIYIHWRMFPQMNNAALDVEAVVASSYEALLNFFL